MNHKQNGIWIGSQDLNKDPNFIKDAQQEMKTPSILEAAGDENVAGKVEGNRRDFLKFLGFGLGCLLADMTGEGVGCFFFFFLLHSSRA